MVESGAPGVLVTVLSNIRAGVSNRNVRRIQAAYVGAETGHWAYTMAILLWAFDVGGAALVGGWGAVRLLLAALTAPLGGVVADRMSRRTFLLANNAVRLGLVLVTAAAIQFDLGLWAVLVPATVLSVVGASFRPAMVGLFPSLVDTPQELTSANATSEVVESSAAFLGSAVGGVLLGLFGVVPVVLLNAVGLAWSLLLIAQVRRRRDGVPRRPATANAPGERFWAEVVGGFRAIAADRDLVALTGLVTVNGILRGALGVISVILAVEALGDPAAVGWINATIGGATLLSGMVLLGFAGRVRLGRLMMVGVFGWCAGMLLLGGLGPQVLVIAAMACLIGVTDPLINVGFGTIPPRLVDDRVLSRLFAALESTFVATCALGAFVTPFLHQRLGTQGAVAILGIAGVVMAVAFAVRIPRLDARLVAPAGLDVLREVPLFAPLTPMMLEQFARRLHPVEARPGQAIVTEGDDADVFYVIESGTVEVTQGGRPLRTQGAGDVFGEIGLLHDVPRTATVTAIGEVSLLTLSRTDFLALMAGEEQVSGMLHDLATRRMSL